MGKANGYGGMRRTKCCDEGFYKEYNTIIPGDAVVVAVGFTTTAIGAITE